MASNTASIDHQLRSHYVVLGAEVQEISQDLSTAENFQLKYGRDCFTDGVQHLRHLASQKSDQMRNIQHQLAELRTNIDHSASLLSGIHAEIQAGTTLHQPYEGTMPPPAHATQTPQYHLRPGAAQQPVSVVSSSPILAHSARAQPTNAQPEPREPAMDLNTIYSPILANSTRRH